MVLSKKSAIFYGKKTWNTRPSPPLLSIFWRPAKSNPSQRRGILVLGDLIRVPDWVQSSRRTLFGRRCAVFETSSLMPGDLFLPRQTSVWRFTGIARETSGKQISTVCANASAIWGWMVSNLFSCSFEHQSSRKLRTVLFDHRTKLFANPPIWPPFKQYDIVVDVETNQESPCISLKH